MKKRSNILAILIFTVFWAGFYFLNTTKSSTEKIKCKDCNVIVVSYDALQAAHVSSLGYKRETTPMIDSLAKQGVSFKNDISAAPWTVPSHMSIFTGLFPSEHKVVNKYLTFNDKVKKITNLKEVSPNVLTLAQVLKSQGYATGGFTGDAGVSAAFGYGAGFDAYYDKTPFGSMKQSGEEAIDWVKENKDKKLFLFLHGYDAHGQFKVADNYQGRFIESQNRGKYKGTPGEQGTLREEGLKNGRINLTDTEVEFWREWYDSKIRDEDDRFKNIWEQLSSLGVLKNAIVLVVSDHGTEFYEHNRFDHGHTLYDELVKVPLVINAPGLPKNKAIDSQVSNLDIAPSIIDLLGIDPGKQYSSQMRGKSLIPLILGKDNKPENVFLETDYRNYTHKRGIRTADGWKFILTLDTGQKELYNLKKDPGEKNNVIEDNARLAFDLEAKVRNHIKDMGGDPYGKGDSACLPVYNDQCK